MRRTKFFSISPHKYIITAMATVFLAVAMLVIIRNGTSYLVLRDANSGKKLFSFPASQGEQFSIEFMHSINRTPVRDIYEIREDGSIYNVSCIYYSFGTGVQTQLAQGETLRYEDGAMIIENINRNTSGMIYMIRQNSTHVLCIGTHEIFLPEQFNQDIQISFRVEKQFLRLN